MPEINKQCKECGKIKPITEFSMNKAYKDGYQAKCKECIKKLRNRYTLVCINCGKVFKSDTKKRKYCSTSCSNEGRNPSVKCKCDICGKAINVIASKYKVNNHNYCSRECADKGKTIFYSGKNSPKYNRIIINCSYCGAEIYINKYKSENQKYVYCSLECKINHQKEIFKGSLNPFYGKTHSEQTKKRISIKNYGKISPNKGKPMSEDQKLKLSLAWTNERKAEWKKRIFGENNPAYNPNLTYNDRIDRRLLFGYSEWRNNVYKRDNYTCQCCGDKKGGNLKAHHLDSYNWCIDRRMDVDNGITLCDKCHKTFHSIYGYGNNTKYQMEDFLKN
ncbi:hypothetical protein EXQ37_03675 [Clostridium botulinum]|nr:NUMOD3 domain-containing DNA-binding protein [Clostridium botulinum]MBO0558944.1 hypothetical protein [Clostridium botulinum]